jgi:hypothetical protein
VSKLKLDNPAVVTVHLPKAIVVEEEVAAPVTEITGQAPEGEAAAEGADAAKKEPEKKEAAKKEYSGPAVRDTRQGQSPWRVFSFASPSVRQFERPGMCSAAHNLRLLRQCWRTPATNGGLQMKLIVGLGHPGEKYESTRHNAGFWLLERFAAQTGTAMRKDAKFQALVGRHAASGAWLMMPQGFMNLSGLPVQLQASDQSCGHPVV